MKKIKSKADKILKENPSENQVFITEDGQAFFSELRAKNHSRSRKFDKDPEVFFREGHEPEDTKEIEEELEASKNRVQVLETALEEVSRAADLKDEPLKVEDKTAAEVVAVIQLREELQAQAKELEETKAELKAVTEKKEENKTKKSK